MAFEPFFETLATRKFRKPLLMIYNGVHKNFLKLNVKISLSKQYIYSEVRNKEEQAQ